MFTTILLGFALTCAAPAPSVTITELMYDPASPERRGEPEWIELMNTGSTSVDLAGWTLDDEDATDWGELTGTLEPGAIAVVINGDAGTAEEFHAAWAEDPEQEQTYLIIAVQWGSLANKPTKDNEVLVLLDAEGSSICTVNYERGGDWPDPRRSGQSIHLTTLEADAGISGSNWALTTPTTEGARTARVAGVFTRPDIGSPGVVPEATPSTTRTRPAAAPKAPSAPRLPEAPAAPKPPSAPEKPDAPGEPEPPEDDVPY
jgi:hypothetical protein